MFKFVPSGNSTIMQNLFCTYDQNTYANSHYSLKIFNLHNGKPCPSNMPLMFDVFELSNNENTFCTIKIPESED